MAKNAVTDWDQNPANNTDIAGTSIAVGCPPSDVGIFMRTIMAQIAVWIAAVAGPLLKSGGAMTGAITGMTNGSTVLDGGGTARGVGYRNLPLTAKTSAYQIALTDVGQGISITTGGITVPANATTAFAVGDTCTIYNNSGSAQTITAAGSVTLRLAGTSTTGNRTLAQRGLCTLLKVATDEWVATGTGVS